MSLKNPVKPPGIDPGTVRLVAQRLNHYATADPIVTINYLIILMYSIPLLSSDVQIHAVLSNTTPFNFFYLKATCYDQCRSFSGFSINPKNQNNIILFEISQILQNICYYNKILILISHTVSMKI
jgi:hypothetical protein